MLWVSVNMQHIIKGQYTGLSNKTTPTYKVHVGLIFLQILYVVKNHDT